MSTRYGGERIRRGLMHFILGKGVSALAGMLAMLLVIRELTVESFAAYSVLVALVEMLAAISGIGLAHVVLRYVPELYSRHYQVSLRHLVYGSLGLRSGVLLLAALAAYALTDELAPHIGLGSAIVAFQVFLLVVVVRATTHFLSQILESTLHQGIVQMGFTIATLARLAGMVYLLKQGDVQLVDVIWVEAIGDALSLLVMLFGVIRVAASTDANELHTEDDGSWLRRHLKQIAKFALAGYAQHLAITPYGGHTNRLVGGNMLGTGAMASYGFAQSLYEYVKRYLPAQLLIGLIRPVVVARYCIQRDFSAAAGICEQVFQINVLLIGGFLTLLAVGGGEALAGISAGKYGQDSLYILAMLLFVLILETQRQQLELLIQTVKRYQYLIPSNVLLAASVLVAVLLIPMLGAVAFPLANAMGLLVANAWVQQQLKSSGFLYRHDWSATLRFIFVFSVAVLFGSIAKFSGVPWYWACVFAALLYSTMGYFLCGEIVRKFIRELLGDRGKNL